MSIRIEIIDDIEAFYPTASEWWKDHGWPAVPITILPKLGVKAIDSNGNRPLAASWLYMDNSIGVSIMEWTVADPKASPRKVAQAILTITDFFKNEAKTLNYSVMLTTCKQQSLANLLTRAGFAETDRDMIHLANIL